MSNTGLNLSLVIRAEDRGGKQAVSDLRGEVRAAGNEAQRTAALTQAANDQAAASARRVTEALTGQTQAQRNLQAAVASAVGIRSPANDDAYRQRAADVAAYGVQLDQLRAKYNPLFAAEQAHIRNLAEMDRALKVGALNEVEHADAVARAAASYELQVAGLDRVAGSALAAKLRLEEYSRQAAAARQQQTADRAQADINQLLGVRNPSAMAGSAQASAATFLAFPDAKQGAQNVALATHEMTNLTYQMNDIVMMLASGQSPFMLMMQQGSQVTQIMGQRGLGQILPALGSALKSLISPTTLLLAGVTAAGYAAYGVYRLITPEVKSLDEVLKDHEKTLKRIGDAYGIIEQKAKGAFSYNTRNSTGLDVAANLNDLRLTLATSSQDNLNSLLASRGGGASGNQFGPAQVVKGEFSAFSDAIEHLRKTAKDGQPDIIGFKRMVEDRWALEPNNAALMETAGKLRAMVADSLDAAIALKELEAAKKRLDASIGPGGLPLRRGALSTEDMGAYERMLAADRISIQRQQQAFDAERQSIYARSPSELAAASRARAAADYKDDEGPDARNRRINMAGQMAYLQAQHQINEALRQRIRSEEEAVDSARLDVELIGKSEAEVARLRMEHELLAQVRAAAADAGVKVDEAEIARIKEKAAELGKLRALQSAREMLHSQDEDLQRLRVEQALIGTSTAARNRLTAQMDAEFEIRRKGIDSMGEEAQRIRANTAAIADFTTALERQRDAWNMVQSAGESAIDSLLDGDWKSAADDIIKTALQLNVANPLKNWIFGSNNPTGMDLGSNILGRLFGGADGGAADAVSSILGGSKSTATMSVNAGIVNVNGALGVGGGSGGLGDTITRLLSGGNDNYAPGAVTRSPLADISVYRDAIKMVESAGSGGYSALGPMLANGNQALGAYQVMSNNLPSWSREALGRSFSVSEFLASPGAQDRVFDHFFGKSLSKYGNPQDAASVWFTGRPMAGGSGAIDALGTTGSAYVDKFNTALGRLDDTTTAATRSLGTFGNGLGQLGNNLANVFPAAPSGGGGGLGGLLGSLFGGGGLNSAFAGSGAYNWLSANPGGFIGLYDEGGPTPPGPRHKPVGIVHAGEVIFSQDDVARHGGVENVEALRLGRSGRRGYAGGGVVDGGFAMPSFGPSGGGGAPAVITGQNGRSIIELRLSDDLVGRILEQASNQSVEIVQANDKARADYWRGGGETH